MFLDRDGKPLGFREATASGISVGVPGVLAMLELAHQEKGKLAWNELFKSAIEVARAGFPVSSRLAAWLDAHTALAQRAEYSCDLLQRRQLAEEAWREGHQSSTCRDDAADRRPGRAAFYRGAIAAEMVERVHSHVRPGTLSLADLANYRPIKREAVCGPYRVWVVCGLPPPSSGGIAILQVLGLVEPFDIWRDPPNSLRVLHLIAEASRLAFADRDRYVADPAFVPVPVAGLISPAYIAERRLLISADRSMGTVGPGLPPGYVERGTSHISIVDRWGNAVSFTTTIEAPFGAQIMLHGFLLNNELTDFSALPEAGGKPVANRVEPGKRPRSAMSPTLIFDQRPQARGGAGVGRRRAHHRRHAAGRDRPAGLGPHHAEGRRPAADHQYERCDRARGRHAPGRRSGRLARLGTSSTSPPT